MKKVFEFPKGSTDPYDHIRMPWPINKEYKCGNYLIKECEHGKIWTCKGKLHRENGPAVEHNDDSTEWWVNDKLHREDGPAIDNGDYQFWILDNEDYTEETHKTEMRKRKLKKMGL